MPITAFDAPHAQYLREQQRGRLATVAPNGGPQNKPVGFRFNEELQTIDIGGFQMERSAKFRNVAVRPQVAFTVDDVPDPSAGADGVRFVEIRGVAEQVHLDSQSQPGPSGWIIRIHPRRVVSWNVAGRGLHGADFAAGPSEATNARPALGLTGALAERPQAAVARQVAEMQAGLGDHDAEDYNRHFAQDVMWGSPYGATVDGYEALHAIHRRMHATADHAASRYEIVRVLVPTPEVAVAQVRRTALDEGGEPIPSLSGTDRFSEMALYVLVRRGAEWWLAAGQNTIVVADRGAVRQDGVS
ncbi:MAG TPA: PPOX class F420-dependent oxidoreductase [Solirubrobacteraceae bacterium]|nr:PPOX class F420-dependent oxidoreductase [Solirubrobacteraceae bacterium]